MSSKEQELTATKNHDDKPDSSSLIIKTPVKSNTDEPPKETDIVKDKDDDSQPATDATSKDCGDNREQTTDNSSKPTDLNKSSEFDDEDDFNSDELQLRWDDDDESVNDEKSNDKEVDESFSKDSEIVNPSTSLVSAVKELENVLIDTSIKDVNVGSPSKDKTDTVDDKVEENSSKEILEDIDKLIGNNAEEKENDNSNNQTVSEIVPTELGKGTENEVMNVDSSLKPEETSDPSAISGSINKTDVDLVSPTKDSVTQEYNETKNPADTFNLDKSTESLEIINESGLLSSTVNESLIEASTMIEHGLKKPDMMLEIPTQELIDCMDFDSDNEKSDEKVESVDVSKQISSLEKDIDDKILDETKEQEITENSSKLSEKDVTVDENITKKLDIRKENIDSKIQESEKLPQKDIGGNVVEKLDSQKEKDIIDPQIPDITPDLNTKAQALENTFDSIVQEAPKNLEDSASDVEMCDFSDKDKALLPNEESDKAFEIENVENTEKLVEISPMEEKTKVTCTDDYTMEVDEIKKELKSVPISEELPKDLEKEHTPVDANISLNENKINDKSGAEPQPSLLNVTNEMTKQTDQIVVSMETSEQMDSSDVLENVPKDKNTKASDVIENPGPDAATSIKSTLEEDTDLITLNTKEMEQKSEIQEKSEDSMDTSQKSDIEPQLEDLKPIVAPLIEPVLAILAQEFVKDEQQNNPVKEQTLAHKLEQSSPEEIKESIKVDPTTENLTFKDETALEFKNKEASLDKPSTSKDLSSIEPTTPTIDLIGPERKLKDPVSDQPSASSESTSNEDSTASIPTEQGSKDPILEKSPTCIEPTSNEKPVSSTLDPIPTEQGSKDPVLDQPSTSAEPTPKELSNVEPTVPTLDPVSSESKDPVDLPSTSKLTEQEMDQIPDTTDEVPEMEDTLGLLAESSRVVDADAEEGSSEGGEAEEDEEGDDDEFDPDDESSNQMTAEHSEESNAQPDKEDGQTDKEDKTPEQEKEFNFAIAAVTTAKEGEDSKEATIEDFKAPDDVTVATAATPTAVAEAETDTAEKEMPAQEEETEDTVKESDAETEAAANSILKDLLLKQGPLPPEMLTKRLKTSAEGVVDLSSSEDDEVNKKKAEQKATSTDKKKEATTPQKSSTPSEETPKTSEQSDVLPEKATTVQAKEGSATNAEVFNLDSDEDDVPSIANEIIIEDKPESNKCINPSCRSGARTSYVVADAAARAYFDADKKKKHRVCLTCAEAVVERTKGLVNGIKEFTPLLELDLRKVSTETVEISDSDSDNDDTETVQPDIVGESGAKFLEEHLADVINETWLKYKLDERLGEAQSELDKELEKLEAESKEIDTMLNECQVATDLLRNQLYATFEPERREITAICIMDTPSEKYSFSETVHVKESSAAPDNNRLKRKSTATIEQPAKRAAIPLGYTPIETEEPKATVADTSNVEDDKDVSVVKLSAESAPSDLPPPGEIVRQPLRAGMSVFAMRNSFCTWVPGKITEIQPKNPGNPFTMCRVRFEIRQKIATRVLAARCLAYLQPAEVRLTIGTRVIALSQENAKADEASKRKTFYSGIVAEIPNPVNSYRYLIFFDHGYAQYVPHRDTRVVCESANLVWEEVHPNSREFVKQYLLAYPERPMVRLHAGQSLKTEWNGKWWVTKVLQVDASLVEVSFEDNRSEWIYRGSTRLAPLFLELQAAERQRSRPLPRSNQRRMNMPYVEYTRSEEQNKAEVAAAAEKARQEQHNEELRRQRAVAKKSTALPAPPHTHAPHANLDSVTSRVVYYTPKNAVKPLKMTPHTCSPKCKRSDVLALKDLRTYNPLAKPLLSAWERQIVRFKGHKEVMYRAPCGRRLRNMRELHRYLRAIQSDMGVDLFDFGANTHCLAEFVLNKCLVGKKDLSHGKENVPVPCVNYYDESLPEFCSYNTERTPTAGVPLNLDPEFLCGCDCTDDCEDKSKCACWKMTLEGARTIGLLGASVGYEYKRLPEPLPSGIYECNSRCKCKQTCLNRVAQHPLQLKLQVFKTMNRGWGIRALNDVPKGSFLCVYAGNLLTDATANLDGLNEGDEYLAELDYIEVVEQMKEGYEEDIPEADKKLDRESTSKSGSEEEEPSSEEEENSNDKQDGDFQPGYIGLGLTEFNKRLRKRDRTRKRDADKQKGKEIDKGMEDDGCITISDDEEAKEPTQFTAQTGIGANGFVPKYKSVRTLFGKDEACYIMDAKVQGNIGRYLNHSCTPNVFVQNVFVDTHDPRFPWVAFFALSHIRAGTELTWNYNYDVGSVPGKVLYCYCGAPNCRGRLL